MQLNYQQSLERCLKAIELVPRVSELPGFPVHWFAVRDLIALGRIGEALPLAARQLELAEESRSRFDLAQALHANGFLAYLEGDWESARGFNDRGLEIDHRDVRLLNWRSDLENQVGNFVDEAIYLDRILETVRLAPSDIPQLDHGVVSHTIGVAARITGVVSRFEAAAAAAEFALSTPSGLKPRTAQLSRTGLALLAVQMGDVTAASEQYSFLKYWPITTTPLNLMSGYRVLGLLAQTMGNLDDTINHFEDSLAFCRQADYRPGLDLLRLR
jgi:tetratricopeptide (TPR) repeat protein